MRILYLGCHSVLEHNQLRMFTEMEAPYDIEVFSLLGSYMNPTQAGDYMRSVIPKGKFYEKLYSTALQCDKDNIHPELLEWADVVFMTHNSAIPGQKEQQSWLVRNWPLFEKMKKRVVWYSIGQGTPLLERELAIYKAKGLKIVRCSPIEEYIPNYAGHDAIIRFDADPDEFKGWTGEIPHVITVAQSFKQRGEHLGFSLFDRITGGLRRKVFGTSNEDLGELWGGRRSFSELKTDLQQARCFFYFGTIPVPYTLSFMEAMMTGIPIVAVGPQLRTMNVYNWKNYEVPDIIQSGVNGYVSDSIDEIHSYIKLLLDDHDTAKRISTAGRNTAIRLFNKKMIAQQWVDFFRTV